MSLTNSQALLPYYYNGFGSGFSLMKMIFLRIFVFRRRFCPSHSVLSGFDWKKRILLQSVFGQVKDTGAELFGIRDGAVGCD